ncbi:MAG: DUF885 family protein [Xanthomonadaceae bacterium]|nr:DUF885 family protein [Xanthomonadaceae bacterium]
MSMRLTAVLAAGAILAGCATTPPAGPFQDLVADYEAYQLASNPIRAGREGDAEAARRWPDRSPDAVAAGNAAMAGFLERLQAIDPTGLDAGAQVSHGILEYVLRSEVELAPFESERMPFLNDSGFHTVPLQVATNTRIRTVADGEAWLARLQALPAWLDEQVAWMRRGLESGWTQPAHILPGVADQMRGIASAAPEDSELFTPLRELPAALPEAERTRLQAEGVAVLHDQVLPAYGEVLAFFEGEYMAAPRASVGISEVPGGRAYYEALVRFHTTLNQTPEQVHQAGLAEVARIRAEMESVIAETGFEGSFAEFLDFLRTDPQFYAESEELLLMHAARLAKLADDQMPRFFGKLPRLPYGVRPVPASIAPTYTTGRYWGGNLEQGIAGGYLVNTYALDQRPLYELPALTVHEGVPGHHHQISLAQELEGVPDFRRRTYITAFGEGWGLYTENLAIDMGIYRTPYEHFGRLTFEMWRACRLVVDTGIHYYGWTVERAEACLLENSALAPLNVRTEVARYVSWPGQALAYKTGEMLMRRLRRDAEEAIGQGFDIRAFHDHLLKDGAMPLSALEAKMRAWIIERQGPDI